MKYFLTLIAILCTIATGAAVYAATDATAQMSFSYGHFAQLPVQHGGRIKPVDTFARGFLKMVAGKESIDGMDAESWLAETLFDPARALHRPVFRLFTPQILGLSRETRYFSYADIAPALQARADAITKLRSKDEKDWNEDQRELARLQEASILYEQLLRSFSLILPLNIHVPEALAQAWEVDAAKPFTLRDYVRFRQNLEDRVKKIVRRKGENIARYNSAEKEVAAFAFEMAVLEKSGENNVLFRVIPAQWDSAQGEWFSPWAMMQSGQGAPATAEYFASWETAAQSYNSGDAAAWNDATKALLEKSGAFSGTAKTKLEIFYNTFHPLNLALAFYLLSFVTFAVYAMRGKQWLYKSAAATLAAGTTSHIAAILMRVEILSRPPVGTLYESIIFVALVCVLIGAGWEWKKRNGSGVLLAAVSGMILLTCAMGFSSEDTLQVLVAVLNTNFWLATHVLCITMGYGWCLAASMAAHAWLYDRARGRSGDALYAAVKTLSLIALLFTAVGTILGGIWADQSWGRFWGWDPKENGALLIVLWLIWILHARIAGQIGRALFMAGIAALSIIVALAWFGVNLLNVGLHSYGFVDGIALGLSLFCAAEAALIYGLFYIGEKGRERDA